MQPACEPRDRREAPEIFHIRAPRPLPCWRASSGRTHPRSCLCSTADSILTAVHISEKRDSNRTLKNSLNQLKNSVTFSRCDSARLEFKKSFSSAQFGSKDNAIKY